MSTRFGWRTTFGLSLFLAIALQPNMTSPESLGGEKREEGFQQPYPPLSEATKQLDAAIRAGDRQAVLAAIEAGADLQVITYGCGCDNGFGEDDFSFVSLAITRGYPEIALILIEAGAALNEEEARRPLYRATRDGNLELLEACLEHGAEVDYLPGNDDNHFAHFAGYEESPLIVAIRTAHPQVVRRLIEAGADIHQTTCIGRRSESRTISAIEYARELGHTECLQLLEEAAAR